MEARWRIDKSAFNSSYALMLEFDEDSKYTFAIVERARTEKRRWAVTVLCAETYNVRKTYRTAAEAKSVVEEVLHNASRQLREGGDRFLGGRS